MMGPQITTKNSGENTKKIQLFKTRTQSEVGVEDMQRRPQQPRVEFPFVTVCHYMDTISYL